MDLNDQTRAAVAELLSKLENARFSAMLGCNLSALQRLLADDLIYIHSTGVVQCEILHRRKREDSFPECQGVASLQVKAPQAVLIEEQLENGEDVFA